MPSRHATKKGKLNGVARKELNLSASTSLVEKTVLGTNEDTVFGRVTKGMDVIDRIQQGDRIIRATVIDGGTLVKGQP